MYSKMLRLSFPTSIADKPIVYSLVRQYDLTFNIFQATISPGKEGRMVMELAGHRKNFNLGLKYLKKMGVKVESVGQDVRRNEEVCYQCGLCTAICPTGAMSIQYPDMTVIFDVDKCSACEMCVAVCPPRAMQVTFNKRDAL